MRKRTRAGLLAQLLSQSEQKDRSVTEHGSPAESGCLKLSGPGLVFEAVPRHCARGDTAVKHSQTAQQEAVILMLPSNSELEKQVQSLEDHYFLPCYSPARAWLCLASWCVCQTSSTCPV